ncbi:hypothetical protein emb_1c0077 [Coriobacteriaceae bacterium EMTCatB1]|nr:hypothetical protein emb_1c0077 [Coriobacteriaceae bacterium EMTCatB1]
MARLKIRRATRSWTMIVVVLPWRANARLSAGFTVGSPVTSMTTSISDPFAVRTSGYSVKKMPRSRAIRAPVHSGFLSAMPTTSTYGSLSSASMSGAPVLPPPTTATRTFSADMVPPRPRCVA